MPQNIDYSLLCRQLSKRSPIIPTICNFIMIQQCVWSLIKLPESAAYDNWYAIVCAKVIRVNRTRPQQKETTCNKTMIEKLVQTTVHLKNLKKWPFDHLIKYNFFTTKITSIYGMFKWKEKGAKFSYSIKYKNIIIPILDLRIALCGVDTINWFWLGCAYRYNCTADIWGGFTCFGDWRGLVVWTDRNGLSATEIKILMLFVDNQNISIYENYVQLHMYTSNSISLHRVTKFG